MKTCFGVISLGLMSAMIVIFLASAEPTAGTSKLMFVLMAVLSVILTINFGFYAIDADRHNSSLIKSLERIINDSENLKGIELCDVALLAGQSSKMNPSKHCYIIGLDKDNNARIGYIDLDKELDIKKFCKLSALHEPLFRYDGARLICNTRNTKRFFGYGSTKVKKIIEEEIVFD